MVGGTPRSDPGHSALVLSHQRPNHRRGCTLHWIGNAKRGQAMTNIIKFPGKAEAPAEVAPEPAAQEKPAPAAPRRGLFAPVVKAVWVVVVLVWPLLKWIVSIDVFFQFIRMVYHWNTPGVFAGWTFLAHFAVLVALTYFVSIYKPKGI
uniref:KleE stable inheritance protein n=4 Tax=root TaxID=1 RepID=K4IYF5_BURCE|nr:KleE stable inheritance protein [uncultured bacterium pAKD4]AFU76024.1 KleE stable inheritance protein [Burkholderia cepacia]